MRTAVFLDRDGVINANRADYVKSWSEFIFLPGVFEALRRLSSSGRLVIVVSNQSAIGRGITAREEVETIHKRMRAEIEQRGGRIDAIFYCPHRPDEDCDCRKPRPGLLLRAAYELGLDLAQSYLVGDAASDVEAALVVGCAPVLVLTGRGSDQQRLLTKRGHEGVLVARDLGEAVSRIAPVDAAIRTSALL